MVPESNGTITGDQLPFNNARAVSTRQSCDNKGEAFNYKTKESVIPGSHKQVIEQTPQSYSAVTPEGSRAITGDQLPSYNAWVVSTRQSRDNREEVFNYKTHNYTPRQTQFISEVSTSESSTLEDPQLPISPTNIRLGTPNKETKKNVQFWTPENSRDQRNSVNRIYDPILITPRHQHSDPSLSRSFQEPIKESSPYPPLNPNGRYF